MIREWIRNWMIGTFISFGVEMLAFVLLPQELAPDLNQITVLQTFVICMVCAMAAILPFSVMEHRLHAFLVSALLLLGSLFGVGVILFELIPFEGSVLLSVAFCCILIYSLCYLILLRKDEQDAKAINQRLLKRRQMRMEQKQEEA